MTVPNRDLILTIVDAVVAEERKDRMRETDGLFRRIMEQGEAHDRLVAQVRTLEKKVLDLDGIGTGTFVVRLAKLRAAAAQSRLVYREALEHAIAIMEGREG